MGYYNYYKLLLFCCYNSATRRKQDLRPRPRSLPGATSAPLFSGEPPPPSQALDARSCSPPPPDWACSSGPAGSGLGRPAPLPERGPPPAHRLRRAPGGRWGRGGGEEPPHEAGVPEPPPNFSPRSPTFGGRSGRAGRGERSSWKEPLGAAAAQHGLLRLLVCGRRRGHPSCAGERRAAPYLWLPSRPGARGSRRAGDRGVGGSVAACSLVLLGVAGRRRRGERRGPCGRSGIRRRLRARDSSCCSGQSPELSVRPGVRASRGRRWGPEMKGSLLGDICLRAKKSAAQGSRRPHRGPPSPSFCVLGSPLQ